MLLFSFIHLLILMVGGGLEPSTAVMGWEMWYTLDRSKVLSQGKHKNRQTFTTVVNVESWFTLTCLSTVQRTHASTWRTCKHMHTERLRFKPLFEARQQWLLLQWLFPSAAIYIWCHGSVLRPPPAFQCASLLQQLEKDPSTEQSRHQCT